MVALPQAHGAAEQRRDVTVDRITDAWGLTALEPQWRELLRASGADSPFLTWDWLYAWWNHLRGSSRLSVLTVRRNRELIAIAPLVQCRGPLPWFSTIEFMGTGNAGSDYLDVIARRGHEHDVVAALTDALAGLDTSLRLRHLREGALASELATRLTSRGWLTGASADGVCPIIDLAGHTWDSYLGTLGSSHRANVRRRLRALDQQFTARFDRVTTNSERVDALNALIEFHRGRFAARGGSSAFLDADTIAFQDEATRRALERGWLRMYVLRLDGAAVAVMYGFLYNRQFYFYQHGFDDRFTSHSVGLALMAKTIQAAIAEGATTFDLLWGVESYKFLWAREQRPLQCIETFPAHATGRVHRDAMRARRQMGKAVRALVAGARGSGLGTRLQALTSSPSASRIANPESRVPASASSGARHV